MKQVKVVILGSSLLFVLTIGFHSEKALAGAKPNQNAVASICKIQGEAVVVKYPPPSDQSVLIVCDQAGPMKTIEPRPLSRAELAKLYTDSMGSAKREDHEQEWIDKFGIQASALRKHDSDLEIGAETLIFAQSETVEDLKLLAAAYTGGEASAIRVATLANDRDMNNFEAGRILFFGSACEQRGGKFSVPNDQLLHESLSGRPISLGGKNVCHCGSAVFSNPVDYACNSSAKDGAPRFKSVDKGDLAPSRSSSTSTATKR